MCPGELKNDEPAGGFFERQLQQIREIHLSERKFYQKVTDLYATAFDYDKDAKTTRLFFQTVQNKMHYAVHRHTAAELIVERADANKEHMGLTTWENAPDGKILKADVTVAKNYLSKEEMNYLERIVSQMCIRDRGRAGKAVKAHADAGRYRPCGGAGQRCAGGAGR